MYIDNTYEKQGRAECWPFTTLCNEIILVGKEYTFNQTNHCPLKEYMLAYIQAE